MTLLICADTPAPLQHTLKAMVLTASDMLMRTWRRPASSVADTRYSSKVSPTCIDNFHFKQTPGGGRSSAQQGLPPKIY